MTNLEYITAKLSKFNLSEEDCKIILIENSLNADDEVSVKDVKLAIYNNFTDWLPTYKSISEGDVNEAWNNEAIRLYYNLLCKELGKENVLNALEDEKSEVRDRSNIW